MSDKIKEAAEKAAEALFRKHHEAREGFNPDSDATTIDRALRDVCSGIEFRDVLPCRKLDRHLNCWKDVKGDLFPGLTHHDPTCPAHYRPTVAALIATERDKARAEALEDAAQIAEHCYHPHGSTVCPNPGECGVLVHNYRRPVEIAEMLRELTKKEKDNG